MYVCMDGPKCCPGVLICCHKEVHFLSRVKNPPVCGEEAVCNPYLVLPKYYPGVPIWCHKEARFLSRVKNPPVCGEDLVKSARRRVTV